MVASATFISLQISAFHQSTLPSMRMHSEFKIPESSPIDSGELQRFATTLSCLTNCCPISNFLLFNLLHMPLLSSPLLSGNLDKHHPDWNVFILTCDSKAGGSDEGGPGPWWPCSHCKKSGSGTPSLRSNWSSLKSCSSCIVLRNQGKENM